MQIINNNEAEAPPGPSGSPGPLDGACTPGRCSPCLPGAAVGMGQWDAEGSRGPAGRRGHGVGACAPQLLSPTGPGSLPRLGRMNPLGFACSCWIYRHIPAHPIPRQQQRVPPRGDTILPKLLQYCGFVCLSRPSARLQACSQEHEPATSRPSWRAAGSFPLPSRNAGEGTVGGNRILRAGGRRVLRPLALPEGSELGKGLHCQGAPRAHPLARPMPREAAPLGPALTRLLRSNKEPMLFPQQGIISRQE